MVRQADTAHLSFSCWATLLRRRSILALRSSSFLLFSIRLRRKPEGLQRLFKTGHLGSCRVFRVLHFFPPKLGSVHLVPVLLVRVQNAAQHAPSPDRDVVRVDLPVVAKEAPSSLSWCEDAISCEGEIFRPIRRSERQTPRQVLSAARQDC